MAVLAVVVVQTCCLPPQSLEECPLDEEDDGFQALGEEDEDIDQFNDDTFGAGAVGELLVPLSCPHCPPGAWCSLLPRSPHRSHADDDWQEAHERLAELEEKPLGSGQQTAPSSEDAELLGEPEDALAERLTRLVIESELEDPAIMRAVHTRGPGAQTMALNTSIWDGPSVLQRICTPLLTQVGV